MKDCDINKTAMSIMEGKKVVEAEDWRSRFLPGAFKKHKEVDIQKYANTFTDKDMSQIKDAVYDAQPAFLEEMLSQLDDKAINAALAKMKQAKDELLKAMSKYPWD